jgi:hypothetical protein
MSERNRPLHSDDFDDLPASSIFPRFDLNIPMPAGTAVPPKVILIPAPPEPGTTLTSKPNPDSGAS